MFTLDIYKQYVRPQAGQKEVLLVQRASLLVTCLGALLFVNGNVGTLILGLSFLSMSLRGCTVLFPLLAAMFLPGFVTAKAGSAAALLGPLTAFLWHILFPRGIDPLYPGLIASLVILTVVSVLDRGNRHHGDDMRSAIHISPGSPLEQAVTADIQSLDESVCHPQMHL